MRSDLRVLGKVIGTITGWDEAGSATEFTFYNFQTNIPALEPLNGLDIGLDFDSGIISGYSNLEEFEGDGIVFSTNILDVLKNM